MPYARRVRRRISCALALALLGVASPVSAAKIDGPVEVFVVLVVGDVVVFVNDLQTSPVSRGYAVGETLLMTPQALILGGATIATVVDRAPEPAITAVAASVATFTGALATHGIWSWANREKSSRDALGVSLLAALDATFLGTALTADFAGQPRAFATPSIVAGAPATVASALGWALDPNHRSGWIALTAASSALVVHGAMVKLLARDTTKGPQARFGPLWLASADARGTVGLGWSGAW